MKRYFFKLNGFLIKNRIIIAFFLVVMTAGLFALVPPRSMIKHWFRSSGYWFVFGSTALWLWVSIPRQGFWKKVPVFLRRHGIAVAMAALLTLGAVLTSPSKFRILADEANLMGMASAMYDRHAFYNPTQGLYTPQGFEKISHQWDKRPLVFPFFVSLLHTLLGYNPHHGFWLNALAGGFSFFLFYFLLQRWFGAAIGMTGMILLAAFPLIILWITSSGFEILNLLFVMLGFLCLDRFLVSRKIRDFERLGMTLLLLAQIRYESVIFFGCLLVPASFFLRPKQYPYLRWTFLLPFLLLPIAWQRLLYPDRYETPANTAPFSFEWFIKNSQHAWSFFTGALERYGTIPLLFFLSLLGIGGGLWFLIRERKRLTARILVLSGVTFSSLILQLGLIFSYYWGNFTLQYAMRLAIVFLPFLIVFALIPWVLWVPKIPRKNGLVVFGSCLILLWYWPIAGKNEAVSQIFAYREYDISLNFWKNIILIVTS